MEDYHAGLDLLVWRMIQPVLYAIKLSSMQFCQLDDMAVKNGNGAKEIMYIQTTVFWSLLFIFF
jgi:hypothetical protein